MLGRLAEAIRAGVAGGVGRAMELEEAGCCATPFTPAEFKGTSSSFGRAPGLSGGTERAWGGLPAVLRMAGTSRGSATGPRALGLGTVFKCGVIF